MKPSHVRVVWLVVLLLPVFVNAQTERAAITGRITDPTKAVITDAHISVINKDTNVRYTTVTNATGSYTVTALPPGTYRVEIEKPGFKTIVQTGIVLHVQDTVELNYEMALGAASESITVEGGAPLVNTESAAVSTVIDRNFVERLPLNGRSFNTLMLLTPGVVAVPSNVPGTGQFSIGGQRTNANMFQVDGVSVNFGLAPAGGSSQAGGGGSQAFNIYGGTSSLVSVDAMQEFRIETSSYAPEFGRTPGGQIIISTRSGTNQFHGAVFDYFRNDVLDANNWFANAAGKPRAPEKQNDFGGVLGGPILRDKTFFFFSYEGLRLRQPVTQLIMVPTMGLRTASTTVAAARPILNAYPQPDNRNAAGSVAQFTGVSSNVITTDAASVRLDHTFGPRLSIFGRYNWSPSASVGRVGSLSTIQSDEINTTTLTIGGNSRWTNNLLTSFRFNYSQQRERANDTLDSFGGAIPLPDVRTLLPSPFALTSSQVVFLTNDVSSLTEGFFSNNHISQWNGLSDLAYGIGPHQLKFGVNYEEHLLSQVGSAFKGAYSSDQIAAFAQAGTTTRFSNTVTLPGGAIFKAFSLYAQDTWKAKRRLTLTYGLRWELVPPPSPQNGTTLASWLNVSDPASVTLAPAGTPIWQTTHGNFAPRFGVAYQLTEKGDLVLRGGWGIFYDLGTGIAPALLSGFPNSAAINLSGTFTLPVPNTSGFVPVPSAAVPYQTAIASGFDPTLQLPYSHQWNVALEKSFGGRQALVVTYTGQTGRRLLRFESFPQPNAKFVPGSTFHLTGNGDTSDYDALQVQYKTASIRRFQALVNYTYSHSLDTSSNDAFLVNPAAIVLTDGERGSSNFDVRHNFSGTVVYDVPAWQKNGFTSQVTGGWSTSAVVFAHSAYPLDLITFFISGGNFITVRPDLNPGQPLWIPNPAAGGGMQLNKAAFSRPTTLREGTLGRNTIRGFGATQVDLSLQRKFALTEKVALQFRTDAFNAFNHPNFANPGNFFSPFVPAALFGRSFSMLNSGLGGLNPLYQIGGPRSLQLSLKLLF